MLEAGKNYGEGIIKEYSIKLTNDLNIKYDVSTLNKMRKFYNLIEKMATLSPNLSYSHYVELLPYDDLNKVRYYIKIVEEENLLIRQLRIRIKSNEYERLPETAKNKLTNQDKSNAVDFVKNPILIRKLIQLYRLITLQLWIQLFCSNRIESYRIKKRTYRTNRGIYELYRSKYKKNKSR